MKAIRFHAQGGVEVLKYEEAPEPSPGPGEVLLRVRAAAVNHLDIWVRQTLPGVRLPHIPGSDAAGVIEQVGEGVTSVRVGERVVAYPGLTCGHCEYCLAGEDSACVDFKISGYQTDGSYAEFAVLRAENVFPLPQRVSFEEGAAFPLVFLTAWHSLVSRGRLQTGESVLIQAAGSGVGSAAVQIAKLCGARIIATAGTPEKCERARTLGAEVVVNSRESDWPEQVRQFTGGRGVDLAFDHVGPATFEGSLSCLAKTGRLVTCGATTGPAATFDIRFLYSRQLSIIGSMLGSRSEMALLLRLLERGRLRPLVDRVLPLSEAQQAQRLLEERGQFGKIVLAP